MAGCSPRAAGATPGQNTPQGTAQNGPNGATPNQPGASGPQAAGANGQGQDAAQSVQEARNSQSQAMGGNAGGARPLVR